MIVKISLPKMAWEELKSYRDENMIETIIRAHFFARVKEFIYDYHNLIHEIRASHKLYYRYCYLPYSLIVDIEMALCDNDCIIEFEEVEYLLSYIIMLVLAESAEARRYQIYFNYYSSKEDVPLNVLLDPSLYSCVRIGLPRNIWQGIVNHAIDPEDDVAVVALTHSGSEEWVYLYDGPSHLRDEGHAVACDAANIYVGGFSTDSGTPNHYDMLVISLDLAGNERWVYRHNGTSNYNDEVSSIIVGQDSNVYISGWVYDSVTSSDFTVVSLDTAGNERWIYKYNAWEDYEDKAYALVYGLDGNIYAAGYSSSSEVFPRLTVISLTPSGNEQWVYRYGNWGLSCYAKSIAYGFDDRVYVAGTRDTLGTGDLLVICLDTLGNEQWVYTYDGPGTYVDWANAIIHGADGNIYVAGTSWGGATQFDYLVISLDSSGTERWVYRYNADVSVDEAYSIVYGQDNFIYTCGKSYHRDTSDDFTVISLIPEIGIVEEKARIKDMVCNSFQIEPNPFHNIIKIKFNLMEKVVNTELKIYDVTGKVLKTFSQLTGQIVWDGTDDTGRQVSEGVYFVQLEAPDYKDTKKVILLK